MDQFSRWSGVAHALLCQQSPKIKLGHVHQLLAACLGHRTYAAFRAQDMATLNQSPRYVLFDEERGLVRASELGLRIDTKLWHEATMALRPSGITPFWLTSKPGMHLAARLTFEDTFDDRIHALKRSMGFPDGHWASSSECHSPGNDLPEILRFDVSGEVHGYDENHSLAIPVAAVVEFSKIGCRIYGHGVIRSVDRSGEQRIREPEEDAEGEIFGMSED